MPASSERNASTWPLPPRSTPALDGVFLVGAAWCAGSLAWCAPWVAGLASLVVLAAYVAASRPPSRVLRSGLVALGAALAFVIGAARAAREITTYERAREAVVLRGGPWPARCEISAVVVRSPVLSGDVLRTDVTIEDGTCEGGRAVPRVRAALSIPRDVAGSQALARGDHVDAIVQLAPLHRFWNEDTGDPRPGQARRAVLLSGAGDDVVVRSRSRGVRFVIDQMRDRIRRRILASYPDGISPMARALVLGEDDLGGDDQRAFRRSGLAHLLAVSGMHLVLVVAGIVAAIRAVLVRLPFVARRIAPLRLAAAIALPLTWMYADLAGGSGSAWRAAWMTSVGLVAQIWPRKADAWRALGLSLVAMHVVDPLVAHDLSFELSAAATIGMIAFSRPFASPFTSRAPRLLRPVVTAVAASVAASLACGPLIASMTADLPVIGIFANLVAVPLGEAIALPLCLVHVLLAMVPPAEHGCALAASGALALVRGIAHVSADLPASTLTVPSPTAAQLAILGVLGFGLSRRICPLRRPVWITVCLALVLFLERDVRARGSPRNVVRVTFLDVGQGDSAIIDLPDGRAIVVDGGGLVGSPVDVGERVLAPVLRARRRDGVALAFLSHPHPDHFGGLQKGLASVSLAGFADTGQGEASGTGGGYADLLASLRARGVPVLRPPELCGRHDMGGAIVDVLAPCPGPHEDRGANDNSFVFRVTYGRRAFLFVGDAEHEAERTLLERGAPVAADVLKVGHHGSRTSSTRPFLAAVSPSVAVISCGVRNRFGHPTRIALRSLADTNAPRVYRTDHDGGVTITTDGDSLSVVSAAEAAR